MNKISKKLDLRKLAISKVNELIYRNKNEFDIESIHFYKPIDGLKFYKLFPHYSETDFVYDWHSDRISGYTILKIISCLSEKNFYGYCRTTSEQLVRIKPKKLIK